MFRDGNIEHVWTMKKSRGIMVYQRHPAVHRLLYPRFLSQAKIPYQTKWLSQFVLRKSLITIKYCQKTLPWLYQMRRKMMTEVLVIPFWYKSIFDGSGMSFTYDPLGILPLHISFFSSVLHLNLVVTNHKAWEDHYDANVLNVVMSLKGLLVINYSFTVKT